MATVLVRNSGGVVRCGADSQRSPRTGFPAPAQGGGMAKKRDKREGGLVEQLKNAISKSGQSLNQLGGAAGVSAGQLSRFVRGERNLSLEAAEKVCAALHLHLVAAATEPQQPTPRRKKKEGD